MVDRSVPSQKSSARKAQHAGGDPLQQPHRRASEIPVDDERAALMSSVPHVNPAHRIASSGFEFCSEDNADVGFTISLMPTNLEPRKY